jgi:hypothetical protein
MPNPLALAQALGIGLAANVDGPTVDVEGAAVLLHCTPRAVYVRHQRGQMPKPLPGARRLVWRVADLLRRGA